MPARQPPHPRRRIFTTFNSASEIFAVAAAEREYELDVVTIGRKKKMHQVLALYARSKPDDLFIFNGEADLISAACLLKLCSPFSHGRIIAVDMVLRQPTGLKSRLLAFTRRRLWREVDRFIHYFKDIEGYNRHYGIGLRNSRHVAFKANLYKEAMALSEQSTYDAGDYIFSAGRSLRDYKTLVEAAALTGLPFAILFTSAEDWAAHGTFLDLDNLPPNVRLIADDGGKEGWMKGLLNAKIVAIPTRPESLCASGIGTYLDAMALGKPVVITRGPGADDILTGEQAAFVPAQDPRALADVLQQLWFDNHRRQGLAQRGQSYALGLGDEQALLGRILDAALHTDDDFSG
jgi:glycosyltransferase involved in cell wall biosynthesis